MHKQQQMWFTSQTHDTNIILPYASYEVIDEPLTSVTELMEGVSSSPVKAENIFVSYNDIISYQVNI